jgi:polyferredoxin
MEHQYTETSILAHVFRPRVLVYTGILATVVAAMLATIWLRSPIKMNVLRDRVSIAREAEDGRIENLYRLQLINTREEPVRLMVRASGVEGIEVKTEVPQPIEVGPAGSRTVTTSLLVEPAVAKSGSHKVTFELFPENHTDQAISEKSTFLVK